MLGEITPLAPLRPRRVRGGCLLFPHVVRPTRTCLFLSLTRDLTRARTSLNLFSLSSLETVLAVFSASDKLSDWRKRIRVGPISERAHHFCHVQQPFDYEHNTLPLCGPSNSRNRLEQTPPLPSFRDTVRSLHDKAFDSLGALETKIQKELLSARDNAALQVSAISILHHLSEPQFG